MKKLLSLILLCLTYFTLLAQTADNRYFELRIYYCHPDKLPALIDRFQNHTTKLFEKHGMENIGYWIPTENGKNALYYILAYPSKETRDKSWAAFSADPEWKKVVAKSEEAGKIVESVQSIFMHASDIIQMINSGVSKTDRTFELRTYYCLPGKLPDLTKRFREHTVSIFQTHQMENIFYLLSEEKDGAQSNLVYMLGFKTFDDATKSWAAFRTDPEWIKVKEASEKDGKIVDHIESVFLKPLAFSKIR